MLRRSLCLVLVAANIPAIASDYGNPSTRSVCTSRCIAAPRTEFPRIVARFSARIEAIAAQQVIETDPDKKRALAAELIEINERIETAQEKSCKQICRNNPDE